MTQGMSAMVTIKSTRAADWTMPIEVALATPCRSASSGSHRDDWFMAAGELAVTINAAADAAVGPFTLFFRARQER